MKGIFRVSGLLAHLAHGSGLCAAAVLAVAAASASARADTAAEFYAGKTISIVVSSDPGGGYDAQARLMGRHIGRFLPGRPATVVQNMPGGGGIVAANYIANVAAQDGTAMGVVQRGVITAQLSGQSGVRFDVATLTWVGNLASENSVMVAWHTAAVKTAEIGRAHV